MEKVVFCQNRSRHCNMKSRARLVELLSIFIIIMMLTLLTLVTQKGQVSVM